MKNLIKSAALLCVAMTAVMSCNKMTEPESSPEMSEEKYAVNIRISGNRTKVSGVSDENEEKVNNVQIFIFDADKKAEYYLNVDDESELDCVQVSSGTKYFYAIVNSETIDRVNTLSDLEGTISLLEENGEDNLVMFGGTTKTVNNDMTIDIDVYRLVSRIDIVTITTSFTSPNLDDKPFSVDSIYVINVVRESALDRKFIADHHYEYLNKRKFVSSGADNILMATDLDANMEGNGSVDVEQSFYVYPNNSYDDISTPVWTPRYTRLVISASLNGKKTYYSINIPVDSPNKIYSIGELVITRPGSDSPDQPVVLKDCGFNCVVKPWGSTMAWNETI